MHAEAAGLADQAAARFLATAQAAVLAGRFEQALACAGRALALAESLPEKGSAAGLQYDLASLRQLEAQVPAALVDQARALGQRLVRALSVS